MANTEKVEMKQVMQVCVVVKDIQKAMERYWNLFGIGPWNIYTFQPPVMKLAVTMIGNMMWELIEPEPLTGPSVYTEFLKEKGEGVHHVLFAVDNVDQAVTTLKKQGINVLSGGNWKGITFAYLDTEKEVGTIFEIFNPLELPLPPPDAIYPPPTSGG